MFRLRACLTVLVVLAGLGRVDAVTFYTNTSAFDAATTTILTEDFEAVYPRDTPIYPSFVSKGNIYTGYAGTPSPNVLVGSPDDDLFLIPNTSCVLVANGLEDFTVDFGKHRAAVGFDTYLNHKNEAQVKVFGCNGLLATHTHTHSHSQVGFLGIVADEPISSIRWTTEEGDWASRNTGIDNIRQSLFEPPQEPKPKYDTIPDDGQDKLVVVTHGWDDDASGGWVEKVRGDIVKEVGEEDWQVTKYDWSEAADTDIVRVNVNARAEGVKVGTDIGNQARKHVHLIGHSAGATLVAEATEQIKKMSPSTVVHTTFLDAYVFRVPDFLYGKSADWAEHYLDNGGLLGLPPYTNSTLPNAYNIDITDVPGRSEEFSPSQWHFWPCHWYANTVDDTYEHDYGWGFGRSMEMDNLPSRDDYPRGKGESLPDGALGGPTTLSIRYDQAQNLEELYYITSDTGTVELNETQLSMQTSSPVWITSLLTPDEFVNFLTFQAEFTSEEGAEGLLAVYWAGELIGMIDERYALEGAQDYLFGLPGMAGPGMYELSFRLDPFTDTDSLVLIDNIATGCAVPEPSTLVLLSMAAIGLFAYIRRRRR